ncbi:hypothetical protein ABZ661_34700, partial [Streptomyces sp. NPDC007057]|uniref:hypothetical protein n=1 Tax=Streptomyces sp. NPDC007057 TaxID=3154586 RepID=UPI0033CC4DFF
MRGRGILVTSTGPLRPGRPVEAGPGGPLSGRPFPSRTWGSAPDPRSSIAGGADIQPLPGLMLGLAIGTKWNALYIMAAFCVMA